VKARVLGRRPLIPDQARGGLSRTRRGSSSKELCIGISRFARPTSSPKSGEARVERCGGGGVVQPCVGDWRRRVVHHGDDPHRVCGGRGVEGTRHPIDTTNPAVTVVQLGRMGAEIVGPYESAEPATSIDRIDEFVAKIERHRPRIDNIRFELDSNSIRRSFDLGKIQVFAMGVQPIRSNCVSFLPRLTWRRERSFWPGLPGQAFSIVWRVRPTLSHGHRLQSASPPPARPQPTRPPAWMFPERGNSSGLCWRNEPRRSAPAELIDVAAGPTKPARLAALLLRREAAEFDRRGGYLILCEAVSALTISIR
jgi:hypothetical protein